jgi:hypothetical protein
VVLRDCLLRAALQLAEPRGKKGTSNGTRAAPPDSTPRALPSIGSVKDDQDDERQKGRELEAKERESHGYECVGLYMRDVDR